ncbi:dTDP-4-dehydrorhamnose reductase [Chitinimonas sp. BJB300]|uniref:dTDP-4-dehydrorhamnose reductase n=1 Tax=Chitinimonas sp. BJB300 TaxID=1559339 RepID=UPI000C0F0BFB|nr:dTDP-4-dehydrorhamnose reductase [Chitinimonas sp. BJB300]PHV12835.1 dTDP-4-dehydrorhamnose reductase [Chitinimonas sp. BJB300]TSJ88040.1 dTDP-4-dehydrorhamnose reductase [Chitinimonas sp. BJB300]
MHTILLTGVNGQVGHELRRSLQGLGTIHAPGSAELNLADPTALRDAVRALKPTLIVNPAAYTAVDKAESEPNVAFAINATAPGVLAEEAQRLGIPLIHYSTDYVYSGEGTTPWQESDATAPPNIYGASKLAGEEAIRASGCNHLILRTSWVYGARGKNFLLTMLKFGRERDSMNIVADQIGAPTWCRTIADLSSHIIARQPDWQGVSGTYHLVNSGTTSWYGFAEAIFRLAAARGDKVPSTLNDIATEDYPTPAKRPQNSRLNQEKLHDTFGLIPPSWEEALAMCFEDQR